MAQKEGEQYDPQELIDRLPGPAPLDEDGFVQSFSVDQVEEIRRFFETYGFVVIQDVLSEEQIAASKAEFWALDPDLDETDPGTWEPFWKAQRFGHLGIIGMGPGITPCQVTNRQTPAVYEAYATVLGCRELWADHDRIGVMRPTRNLTYKDGHVEEDKDEWRTVANWLHLDCNPLQGHASIAGFASTMDEIDFTKTLIIQGLLTLTDARVEDGGFHCVPGSNNVCVEWCKANPKRAASGSNFGIPETDPLFPHIQQIPVRRGCALLWTSLLMHGNHPNRSDRFRMCQYVRFVPTKGTPYSPLITDRAAYADVEVTPLGERLFGLQPWPE